MRNRRCARYTTTVGFTGRRSGPTLPAPDAFIDTNVLLYLLCGDPEKADRAEEILRVGGRISVQVLNELASVARRKSGTKWGEINECLGIVRSLCPTDSLTPETHDRGMAMAERYGLGVKGPGGAATPEQTVGPGSAAAGESTPRKQPPRR